MRLLRDKLALGVSGGRWGTLAEMLGKRCSVCVFEVWAEETKSPGQEYKNMLE
jgi:hypothetical protein